MRSETSLACIFELQRGGSVIFAAALMARTHFSKREVIFDRHPFWPVIGSSGCVTFGLVEKVVFVEVVGLHAGHEHAAQAAQLALADAGGCMSLLVVGVGAGFFWFFFSDCWD